MTCPWTLLKDLLAFEIKSPRTKAAIVATIAIDTETKLLVWSVKCCSDTRRRTIAPANAPVKTTAKTRRAMMSELNIILFRHWRVDWQLFGQLRSGRDIYTNV
jgi:hypothetical protein